MGLNWKQSRGIGYSIAKSALKIAPSGVNVRKFIDNYVKTDKTYAKVLREGGTRDGLQAGVNEAIQEFYSGQRTRIFDSQFQSLLEIGKNKQE